MSSDVQQYIREFKLLVSKPNVANNEPNAIDLSNLRCKFVVKRSDTITPNVADIRVYNVSKDTALKIQKEFSTVILQAGYEGNYGVIFQGNIKQVIIGRESATDTFIDIVAGDGDRAYNFAIVNSTIAAGATQQDQLNAVIGSMQQLGVTSGYLSPLPSEQLPRGKVLYGNARNYLIDIAQTSDKGVSIQDEKITLIDNKSYAPGERVVLTSKTGMIGTPQQTNEGINIKCLLNPRIKIGGLVEIDNASIERLKINLTVPNSAANIPAPITDDGVYYVLVAEHQGDTRGVEWYTTLICLNTDVSSNPINSVQPNYG